LANGFARLSIFRGECFASENVIYDTGDDEGVSAFGLQYHAVEPFEAEPGAHDRQRTWFWVDGGRSGSP
jgi:hypothetical protein